MGDAHHVNSDGFRDREFSEAKGNRFRIAAIGDSITFGSRLSPPSVLYPKQLERLLQSRLPSSDIEVLNFGVTGYDVINNVEHLRVRALKFQPDIVLLGFCANDIGTSSTAVNQIIRHESLKFGFHFVDVFEPFDKAGLRGLRNEPDDEIHPNVDGHAIIAKEVQRYLATSGLLTASSQ